MEFTATPLTITRHYFARGQEEGLKTLMLWAWLPRKSGGAIQGRIQDFPNWGVETHNTKSRGGGGGGFCTLQARYEKGEGVVVLYASECGGRLLSEDAEGTFYERGGGGVATPKPRPPPPPCLERQGVV